jgi:hypothetical protein
MTTSALPQMLDDSVYRRYLQFIEDEQYDRILDSLVAAADFIRTNPYEGDHGDVSVGTILHIMVDSIKVMSGEVGTLGRIDQRLTSDPDERSDIGRRWQKWLHSLETLSLAIGEDLDPFPQTVRDEYILISSAGRSKGTAERMLRLWRASRPFMYKWLYFAKSQGQSRTAGEAHLVGLKEIFVFCYGLKENWNPSARALYDEMISHESDHAPWNEALRQMIEMYDRSDEEE